jgi:putative component of membrane protein insertase Oxa1/YidC/SpoIIIJ protein YidD
MQIIRPVFVLLLINIHPVLFSQPFSDPLQSQVMQLEKKKTLSLEKEVYRAILTDYRIVTRSDQDDVVCPFQPSCSHYSEDAVRQYGFIQGLLLTADRLLIRHHLNLKGLYPVARQGRDLKYLDPVRPDNQKTVKEAACETLKGLRHEPY